MAWRPAGGGGEARLGTVVAMPLLVLLFLVVPILEIYVLIQVGEKQEIGALSTIALVIVISVTGAWLAKREGIGVWMRMQQQFAAGRVPSTELIDGFLRLASPLDEARGNDRARAHGSSESALERYASGVGGARVAALR